METKNKKYYLIQHLREKYMWFRRVYWRLPKKFKSSCLIQTKVCNGKQFGIYK